MRKPSAIAFVLASLILILSSHPAAAQPTDDRGTPIRVRAMLLGGASGMGEHWYGGVEAGVLRGRIGVAGLGQLGEGNGYRSTLVAGGPALEIVDAGVASLMGYGGLGWYGETQSAGFSRSTSVLYLGSALRIPVGFAAIGVTASFWRGTMDDEYIVAPFPVSGHRFSIGVGL